MLAHRLRRRADAILTGSGTVLADDPAFTVRLTPDHPAKQRQLVILDRRRRTPAAYLDAARARGLNPLVADDLKQALATIASSGALEVLVEAGPLVTQAVLGSGLWDEHVLIQQTAGGNEDRVTIRRREDASPGRKE
jgi:diaminohydroxyphosphoribosylaminopyrimidine deaminase/5-amino-6-(5-phosphoribosylamino)uracil reductase